jgi:two-component system chemotaxis response regulator CheB
MSRIIVVGASVGGVHALQCLAENLPASLPAPVLVVLHIGAHSSIIPELMAARGPMPAAYAQHRQELEPGRIYVAPPDHHMLLVDDRVCLNRGAKEHHSRPAIDPLFLSAALSRGADVIGVVLTGRLDDGTFGLQAVKRCGGIAVVQDPADADEPSMPRSALENVEVDHCVRLTDMAPLLSSLASMSPATTSAGDKEPLMHEQAVMLGIGDGMEHLKAIGKPSPFVCPDCKGGLWEVGDSNPARYRCHTGHAFTIRTLQHALWLTADDSVWTALRALNEKSALIKHMARLARARGEEKRAMQLEAVVEQIDSQSETLHRAVEQSPLPFE